MPRTPATPTTAARALRERVKELEALYGIARAAERGGDDLDALLDEAVRRLPRAWQYPETARARIVFRGRTRQSPGFTRVRTAQEACIRVAGEEAGTLTLGYAARRPEAFEGPFLREERALLEGVADYLGQIAGRIEAARALADAHRLLTAEREALREANAALRGVLARIEEEKRELRQDLRSGVDRILAPILHAMELELPGDKRAYVALLRTALDDLAAPFAARLGAAAPRLTPAETAICAMIRGGLRTKDIARLRGLSPATVHRHRENIRRKLGLTGQPLPLATRLHTLSAGEE
jgi:DNA-binding CsgD family transcriptional regulator